MKHALWLALLAPLAAAPRASVDVLFSPDGGVQDRIIEEIGKARKSVDVAIFTFTADPIADALIKASKGGVKVRVLVDWYQHEDKKGRPMKDLVKKLRDAGVDVKGVDLGGGRDDRDPPIFHHKFAVVDEDTVLTGSYNWTQKAESENHENLIVVKGDKKTAGAYVQNFDKTWDSSKAKSFP